MRHASALLLALGLAACATPNQRLVRAAYRGDADAVASALKADGVDPSASATLADGYWHEPLSAALWTDGDRADIARLLLAAGADPNIRNDKYPLLTMAIRQEKWAFAHALLDHGADPQALDDWNDTPLENHLAGTERCAFLKVPEAASLIDRLLPKGPLTDEARASLGAALASAGRCGDVALVAKLQAASAGVETSDYEGRTPLLNAAAGLNVDLLRVLLAGGADVRAADDQGRDACALANLNDMDRREGRDWPARKEAVVEALRKAGLAECKVWSREEVAAYERERFEKARLAEARRKERSQPARAPFSWEALQKQQAEARAKAEADAAAAARAEQEAAWYNVQRDTSAYDHARACPGGGTFCGDSCCGTGLICCVPDGAVNRQGGVCKAIQAGHGCWWGTHQER